MTKLTQGDRIALLTSGGDAPGMNAGLRAAAKIATALGLFVLVGAALLALGAAFVGNDFSVLYVASNSNSTLPLMYRIAGVWGGHEGSLLLWVAML